MDELKDTLTLVTRKSCFGLPTACPSSLPVYIYLKFSQTPFNLSLNFINPDSDHIPYVENGTYVAYNNEKGGVIESLKEDGVLNLDSELHSVPEWISIKSMVSSWLADALLYEFWVVSDGDPAREIYYSDLPWPIGKLLFLKKNYVVKQLLGITTENVRRRELEIYNRAVMAYEALSTQLGEQTFFFKDRPTSLDAVVLGHTLLTLQALPETSVLRSKLVGHDNLVKYAENLKTRFLESGSSSSASNPLSFNSKFTSSMPRTGSKPTPKREKTEEEKRVKKRAKYFLATQLVAVLIFLSLQGGLRDGDLELDGDLDFD